MAARIRSAALYLRTARRLVRGRPLSLAAGFQPLDERLVFVIGSPRSGTTFLAGAIGSSPGFVDLGEVAALKAAIPDLTSMSPAAAAKRIGKILTVTRRLGLVGNLRGVEQTPETAFVTPAVRLAFPDARFVHIMRDGRDVVASLHERGWLSAGRSGGDDAGLPYGIQPRFWVEPERRSEFAAASDVRRAIWAWRRYVEAALAEPTAHVVRYERLAEELTAVVDDLATFLDTDPAVLGAALRGFSSSSIGRFREDLLPDQLGEIELEAGELLERLGYLQ